MLFKSNKNAASQDSNQSASEQPVADAKLSLDNLNNALDQIKDKDTDDLVMLPQSFRLFRKNPMAYSGPETLFENEAWALGRSNGVFHKNRAILEERPLPTNESEQ